MDKKNMVHHIDCLLAEILPGVIPAPEFWRVPNEHEDVVELREISRILADSSEKLKNSLKQVLIKRSKELVKVALKYLRGGISGLVIAAQEVSLGSEYSDLIEKALLDSLQEAHKSLKTPGGILPEKLLKSWVKEVALLWTQKAEAQMRFEIIGFALDQYLKTLQIEGGE